MIGQNYAVDKIYVSNRTKTFMDILLCDQTMFFDLPLEILYDELYSEINKVIYSPKPIFKPNRIRNLYHHDLSTEYKVRNDYQHRRDMIRGYFMIMTQSS